MQANCTFVLIGFSRSGERYTRPATDTTGRLKYLIGSFRLQSAHTNDIERQRMIHPWNLHCVMPQALLGNVNSIFRPYPFLRTHIPLVATWRLIVLTPWPGPAESSVPYTACKSPCHDQRRSGPHDTCIKSSTHFTTHLAFRFSLLHFTLTFSIAHA